MPTICYASKDFADSTLRLIVQINHVIEDYQDQGFRLTVRQLYYQLVAADRIANTVQSYKRIVSVVGDARNAGLIDWEAIEDRTRYLRHNSHWANASEILESCAVGFRLDLWDGQPFRPEVWIEKDALVGVFEPVCTELDVPLFSCRGFTSLSEMWAAGQRHQAYLDRDQQPVVLHFGDHDPSGLDMSRDIHDRLLMYVDDHFADVERLALTRDQIDEHSPPPNPAKATDSRFRKYAKLHGTKSWELDALPPNILADLVRQRVAALRDDDLYLAATNRQGAIRYRLKQLAREETS